jgi:hypothetical protein
MYCENAYYEKVNENNTNESFRGKNTIDTHLKNGNHGIFKGKKITRKNYPIAQLYTPRITTTGGVQKRQVHKYFG